MSNKVTIGALVYLNSNVYDRRISYVKQSLQSFETITSQSDVDFIVINNGGGKFAENIIKDNVVGKFDLINLSTNFYDVAIHVCSLARAIENNSQYVVYTYDDFVHYDSNWVSDAVQYMDMNQNIDCIRLTKYEFNNRKAYDKAFTSTYENPESCRHTPGPGNIPLKFSAPQFIGRHTFYSCNWFPNSRPTMWRTEALMSAIGDISKPMPIMQMFEKRLSDYAERKHETWLSGFLDTGVCHTFPISTSERCKNQNLYNYIMINGINLLDSYFANST